MALLTSGSQVRVLLGSPLLETKDFLLPKLESTEMDQLVKKPVGRDSFLIPNYCFMNCCEDFHLHRVSFCGTFATTCLIEVSFAGSNQSANSLSNLPISPLHRSRGPGAAALESRTKKSRGLEVELHCKLNQPWVVARRGDAAEVAWINDLTSSGINYGGVEIAARGVEVNSIEEVEELCAEL